MQERPDTERRRIELSVVQVVGSALAAVSSAFLLSKLGAAGTVIGAAIASVVATVGSAVYVHVFRRTSEQLRDVRAQIGSAVPGAPGPYGGHRGHGAADTARTAGADPGASGAGADDATRVLPVFEPVFDQAFDPGPRATAPLGPTGEPAAVREQSRARTWLVRSGIAAVAVFAIAMASITVVELGMGRSFASLFGNGGSSSTIGDFTGGGGDKPTPEKKEGPQDTPGTEEGTTQDGQEDKGGSGGKDPSGTPASPTPGASQGTPSDGTTDSPDPTGGAKPPTGSPDPTGAPSSGTPPTTPSAPPSGGAASPPAGDKQSGSGQQADTQRQDAGSAS
ncbi:hypothetical protein [Streptodolium elevatio]|uniref:Uncharacterized protein n=1 Tax=Streptodolium elevatio TaxID=3157996 RepID=A0ABV3DGY4_9ACTN